MKCNLSVHLQTVHRKQCWSFGPADNTSKCLVCFLFHSPQKLFQITNTSLEPTVSYLQPCSQNQPGTQQVFNKYLLNKRKVHWAAILPDYSPPQTRLGVPFSVLPQPPALPLLGLLVSVVNTQLGTCLLPKRLSFVRAGTVSILFTYFTELL